MNCKNCQKELQEDDKFCSNCGHKVYKDDDDIFLDLELEDDSDEDVLNLEFDDIEIDDSELDEGLHKANTENIKQKEVDKSTSTLLIKIFLSMVFLTGLILLVVALGPLWIIAIILLLILISRY